VLQDIPIPKREKPYRVFNMGKVPIDSGMVPVSELNDKSLRKKIYQTIYPKS
jgi:hypothetical protein